VKKENKAVTKNHIDINLYFQIHYWCQITPVSC